jgi:DNA-binding PadR family transcriptional regulator
VLTLIAEQPRHGYEIESVIEARGMREWTEIGFSSIYYLLKKLEKAGWVQSQVAQVGQGPARKVYEITPGGREALRVAVLDALSSPRRCRLPIRLGLANLAGVSPEDALAALGQYGDALAERLAAVRARWEAQRPLPYFVEAMFGHSVALIEAELEWVQGFVEEYRTRIDAD